MSKLYSIFCFVCTLSLRPNGSFYHFDIDGYCIIEREIVQQAQLTFVASSNFLIKRKPGGRIIKNKNLFIIHKYIHMLRNLLHPSLQIFISV